VRRGTSTSRLDRSAAADQTHHEQNQRYHEQHIDKVAQRVATDQSEEPQNQQDNRNGEKHRCPLLLWTDSTTCADRLTRSFLVSG
jgi:hypothetical protein